MPVNSNISIPFIPSEGITSQILSAMQLANEHHAQQQQNALQQGQLQLQQQAQPSQIAERESNKALIDAQTESQKFNLQARKDMFSQLTGQQLGAPPQVQPNGQPAPQTKGMIGDTVDRLTSDPSLSSTEKNAITVAGIQARLKAGQDPATAMEGIVGTYNDILKQHGDNARAIKTELMPDSKSSTGYSMRGTLPSGDEAYRITAPPPDPKNLEEASSFLGRATLAYKNDPTDGNKSLLDLYTKQHDAMFKDKQLEVQRDAAASARARGADVEAMFRTGKNPITGETLSLNNAPPGALVNPSNGQVIPQDMVTPYKPTMNERQTADTARQVLAISQDLRDQIAKNPDLIGPIAGRSQEALQKAGLSAQDASKLLDDISFLQSAATKMHTGRFSGEIMQKMGNTIKPGMNADEFTGALNSINDVATRYANEDKLTTAYEYQQRQEFENQQAKAAPAAASKGPTIGTVEGGYKFKGGDPSSPNSWEKQ